MASERRHCCDLAVHTGRLQYRSCHRAGRSVKSRRAVCAHGARCPSLGVGRRCSRFALAVHIGRLQYRSCHCAGRSFKSRRVHGALMVLDALFGVRLPPPLCSRRPHWTFVYRSRHRARRPSSRDALDALMVLDALVCVGPAVAELSPSTSRTFIPLLSSYRAILQVETHSSCSHGSRCPFWRLTAAAAVLSPVHIGRFYRSRHRAGRMFKSRRALIAFTVLDALLWRQAAAAAVLSPSTSDVCTALSPSCKAIVQVETRSMRSHGSRCPLWRRTAAAAVLLPSP